MASNRTFREPKSAVEESGILENAVPKSTRSVNKWAMKIFGEWQAERTSKKAREEESGSAVKTSQIQDLETNICCDMTAESLLDNEVHHGSMQRYRRRFVVSVLVNSVI